jgi:uncharacterized protein (DUF1778 family)
MVGKRKNPDLVKTYMLRVRMTTAERELLEQAAQSRSLGLSSWARSELVALAKKTIKKD